MRTSPLLAVPVLVLALALPAVGEPVIPSYGLDSASLGRGGTVVAAHGGASSAFGNPANLRGYGAFSIGGDSIRTRASGESSWALRIIDSESSLRGALMYVADPSFAGFEEDLLALGLAESIGSFLILGQGLRTGKYMEADGHTESLSTADLGAVLSLGQRVSVGFVARNLYRSDEALAPRIQGTGILLRLPWTMDLTADYEKTEEGRTYPSLLSDPSAGDESEFRAGLEFAPLRALTARLGCIMPSETPLLYTAGLTYSDQNGTLDGAIAYDPENERTVVVTFGISIGR